MAVILEVKAGPFAGKRVAVMGGQTVTVGRTTQANFPVPHDTFMSGLHFSLEFGPKGCLLTDRSRNGTFVNGARVKRATLAAGDEVRSGQTVFAVRFVDEAPLSSSAKSGKVGVAPLPLPRPGPLNLSERPKSTSSDVAGEQSSPPAFATGAKPFVPLAGPPQKSLIKIGSWTLTTVPAGWIEVGEYGIQRDGQDVFPSNTVASEEPLGAGLSLQEYVESQLTMLRQYLRQPEIDATIPPKVRGAEESMAIEIRYQTKEGQAIFFWRVYVRAGRTVGILAFTTLQSELVEVRPVFDSIVSGAGFGPR